MAPAESSRGIPDEAGRPTFTNHTVIARTDVLRSGQITLEAVYRSVKEFDRKAADVGPEGPLLKVPARPEAEGQWRFGNGIHKHLTFPAIESLATRIMTDPNSRTLLLCRNTTAEARKATLNLVYELLAWGGGLPLMSPISEAPRSSQLTFSNFVAAAQAPRPDSAWP